MSKTHESDGKKYREVERKAEVGDYVIQTSKWLGRKGHVSEVIRRMDGGIKCESILGHSEYRVLEPIEAETTAPDIIDLIANLSAEVTQLKRSHAEQLDTLFRNVQQLAEEMASLQAVEKVDRTPITLEKWMIDRLMGGYRG